LTEECSSLFDVAKVKWLKSLLGCDTRELYLTADKPKLRLKEQQASPEKMGATTAESAKEQEKLLGGWQWAYPEVRRRVE